MIGGHTGYKTLEKEIWSLTLGTWEWRLLEYPEMTGKVPSAGSRHTTTPLPNCDSILVIGGSDTNTFKEVHEMDTQFMRW